MRHFWLLLFAFLSFLSLECRVMSSAGLPSVSYSDWYFDDLLDDFDEAFKRHVLYVLSEHDQ